MLWDDMMLPTFIASLPGLPPTSAAVLLTVLQGPSAFTHRSGAGRSYRGRTLKKGIQARRPLVPLPSVMGCAWALPVRRDGIWMVGINDMVVIRIK